MFVISKDFTFSAAHRLDLGDDHPCSRLHGHNYVVRVEVCAEALDAGAMVLDYRDLAPFGLWLDENFDHRCLNDTVADPTAEVLAFFLYGQLAAVVPNLPDAYAVGVSETPRCWAWYRP